MNQKHEQLKGIIRHLDGEVKHLKKLIDDLEYWEEKKVDEKIMDTKTSLNARLNNLKEFLIDKTRPVSNSKPADIFKT